MAETSSNNQTKTENINLIKETGVLPVPLPSNIPKLKSNIINIINGVYTKNGYLDRYGGSIFFTVSVIIGFSLLMTYFNLKSNSEVIKKNWPAERCKPLNLPFAGTIMQPNDMTTTEYTVQNFTFCVQSVFSNIMSILMIPFQYLMVMMSATMSQLFYSINQLRIATANFRFLTGGKGGMFDMIKNIQENVASSYIKNMSTSQSIFEKINGIFATSINIGVGIYESILSALHHAVMTAIIVLVILIIIVIIGWVAFFIILPGLPWTFALVGTRLASAIIFTIIMIAFVTLMAIVINFIQGILEKSGN